MPGRLRCYSASTRGQTHGLQVAKRDDHVRLCYHEGHPNLRGPIDNADDVRLALRRGACSRVSQSYSFTHDARS
jgi:hypothetical protein